MKKYIIWLIIFSIIEISLALYLTVWREHFWQSVEQRSAHHFIQQLSIFLGAALCICLVSGISGYLISLTTIKWREKLTEKAFAIREQRLAIENLNQRIQEDCSNYPALMLNLGLGSVKSIMYIIVFSVSLVYVFSIKYFLIVGVYAIVGTLIVKYIAHPLISLNYESQRVEATYRNQLCVENFKDCIHIMLGIAKKQKHLNYFQSFYGQIAVIVPLLIIAPEYFMTSMSFGMLMRFNSTAGTILENMSYGVNVFGDINRWLSCRKRLKEAKII